MIQRLKLRKSLNRYDKFKNNFYVKVQKGFLKIAKKNKSKYKLIDSNKSMAQNKSIIIEKIDSLI